jgi:hypothetical protein
MNLSALRDQTAKFCADIDMSRYGVAAYLTAINRAQEQFAMETRSLWEDEPYTSSDGVASYTLPTDFMFEESVYFNGKPLDPVTRRDLAILSPDNDWTITTGTPTKYLIDPEEATKQLLLYPIPTSADASKTISLRYFPLPAALADDTDTPLNSSLLLAQFHIGIAAYASWLLLAGETSTPEIQAKRRDLLQIYTQSTDKAVELFGNTVSAGWRMRGTRH